MGHSNTNSSNMSDDMYNWLAFGIPCGWLWLSLIGYIPYLRRQKSDPGSINPVNTTKMVLSVCLAITYIAYMLVLYEDLLDPYLFSTHIITFCTVILSIILQYVEWRKGLITSGVNFIFYFLAFFTMGIYFFKRKDKEQNVFDIVILIMRFFLVVAFSFADRRPPKDLTPVERASFLSRITFFWMTRFMIKGCNQKLSEQEVPSLLASEKADQLHQKFKRTQQKLSHQNLKLTETSSTMDSVSLIKVLIHMYWKEMMITFTLRLFYDMLIFLNPFLLEKFMTHLEKSNSKDKTGYIYCLMFFTINILSVLLDQAIFARGWKTGINVSSTLMTTIYDKIQKIGMQSSENVVIINLLSTDVNNFREMIPYLFILWSGPFQTFICFGLLFHGIKGTAAFCFLIVPLIIFFCLISKKIIKIQNDYTNIKGDRIQLLEEMIEYIKSVKLFAQEDVYLKKLRKIRDKEINHLKKRVYYESLISTLGEITPQWITLLIFVTLSLMNNITSITPQHIFVTLMALNILETNLSMYSACIFDIIKAKESYKNIVTFLKLEENSFKPDEEIPAHNVSTMRSSLDLDASRASEISDRIHSVVITDATFKDKCLKHINLKIKVGELVAVCGNHNSGKSALLYALLGQIQKESGKVCRLGKVAFTPQRPWVINDTVKMNILFGKHFHKRHFQQAFKYCCLESNVDEETIINGKGSNFSEGQLYRINLARAVYSRPNIFLLDNPLCAVDVFTARSIYNNLLGDNGLLKKITRIIVTQPTAHWLEKADQIIVMNSNTIAESGTYRELMSKNGKFVQLLGQCPRKVSLIENERRSALFIKNTRLFEYQQINQTTSTVGSKFWKTSTSKSTSKFKVKSVYQNTRDAPSERFGRQLSRKLYMNKKSMRMTQLKFEELSTKNSDFKVAQRVFRKYLKSIGVLSLMSIILMGAFFEVFKTSSNILFEKWSNTIQSNSTAESHVYLIYSGSFSVVAGIFLLLFGILLTFFTAKASCKIHHSMSENVFNRPLTYFEGTDAGLIMLSFTENLNDVDIELPDLFHMWIKDLLKIMISSALLIYYLPYLAIVLCVLLITLVMITRVFVLTTSLLQEFNFNFQRLLYTHFLETESGTHIINAFNSKEIFIEKAYKYIDNYQKFFWSVKSAERWAGTLLQFIGCLLILVTCIYFVGAEVKNQVGLILTYLILTVKCFDWVVRIASEIAIKRVSLDKIQKFRDLNQDLEGTEDTSPSFQIEGEIEFLNYSAAYGNSNCLNDINLCIKAGEKVGIVGKSGSGKSSLMMAITRLITCVKGRITFDGKDIRLMNPRDLRSQLTIFPQNTDLFTGKEFGTLRCNLDPEDKFSDEKLTTVLREVHLDGRDLNETCEMFSGGDQQLIGLAKCILNKTKVLILDECTANVCATRNQEIQDIIKVKFSDCTVLNIVHRLEMVEKYDKILVMDAGEVKGFDSPMNLVKKKNAFYMKLKAEDSNANE